MSFDKDMQEVISMLKKMNNYDINGFAKELKYWIRELKFFYNIVVPNETNNASTSYYKVKPSKRPNKGQVAYFNLRRGYPKEIFGGHYCYIFKDLGSKYIIIPSTSVKIASTDPNPNLEIDIKLKNFKNNKLSRLHISDIRAIDIQRINEQKNIYDVITPRDEINQKIRKILFAQT